MENDLLTDEMRNALVYNGGSYKKGGWFTTFLGNKINPLDLDINMIDIRDISHALSNICRFGGHVNQFYSVAQHSVHASQLVDPKFALNALLHDAAEAYIGDMVRPMKETEMMEGFRNIEHMMETVIAKKFNLPCLMTPEVKVVDNKLVIAEAMRLFNPIPGWAIDSFNMNPFYDFSLEDIWSPSVAKVRFMARFSELLRVQPDSWKDEVYFQKPQILGIIPHDEYLGV